MTKKFPLPFGQRELFCEGVYGATVLVGVGVPVAVGVADGVSDGPAAVVLVTVGVADADAVVLVAVGVAEGETNPPEALKMIGPAHKERSPVAGPVERTVRMNFKFGPANGVRSMSAL